MPELGLPMAWVNDVSGSAVIEATRLAGGLDAVTMRCVLADGRQVLLRVLPDPAIAARQPISTDLAFLNPLAGLGLPVPEVLARDETGLTAGCPALLLSWSPGRPEPLAYHRPGATEEVLKVLERVSRLDPVGFASLPRLDGARVLGEPWSGLSTEPLGTQLWAAMRAALPDPARALRPIHADAWWGNLVWQHGRLTGVIDWSDGSLGDPAADLAIVRMDLAVLGGMAPGTGWPDLAHQRFWDLWSVTLYLAQATRWWPAARALGLPLSLSEQQVRLREYAESLL